MTATAEKLAERPKYTDLRITELVTEIVNAEQVDRPQAREILHARLRERVGPCDLRDLWDDMGLRWIMDTDKDRGGRDHNGSRHRPFAPGVGSTTRGKSHLDNYRPEFAPRWREIMNQEQAIGGTGERKRRGDVTRDDCYEIAKRYGKLSMACGLKQKLWALCGTEMATLKCETIDDLAEHYETLSEGLRTFIENGFRLPKEEDDEEDA